MHFICIYNILPDNISLDYSFINRIFPKLLGLNVDNKSRQDFLMDTNLAQTNKINQLIFKNLYEPSSGSKKKKNAKQQSFDRFNDCAERCVIASESEACPRTQISKQSS